MVYKCSVRFNKPKSQMLSLKYVDNPTYEIIYENQIQSKVFN